MFVRTYGRTTRKHNACGPFIRWAEASKEQDNSHKLSNIYKGGNEVYSKIILVGAIWKNDFVGLGGGGGDEWYFDNGSVVLAIQPKSSRVSSTNIK